MESFLHMLIAGLADEERHSLSIWLNGLEYDDWDKQMATDFSPGARCAFDGEGKSGRGGRQVSTHWRFLCRPETESEVTALSRVSPEFWEAYTAVYFSVQ